MSTKVRILLCIAVLSIIGAVFIVADSADEIRHDPEYTVETSAVVTDAGVFFMEYWNGMGRLYRVSDSGEVLAMNHSKNVGMDHPVEVAAYDNRVYALYSSDKDDKDGSYKVFRIAVYDTELELTGVTDPFTIDSSLTVSAFTVDSLGLYITALSQNGASLTVFTLPSSRIRGIDALDDNTADPEKQGKEETVSREDYLLPDAILYRERSTARFFVDAAYKDSELYVLLDGDTPFGIFAPDMVIKNAVDAMHFSPGQNMRLRANMIIKIAGIFVIWLILVFLSVKLTRDRDRIVYLYLASEVVLLLILLFAFIFIKRQFQKSEMNSNTRYMLASMQDDLKYYNDVDYEAEDFYDSTRYYRLLDNLIAFVNKNGSENVYRDAFVMRKSTGLILADARGFNRIHTSYLYGGDMTYLIDELQAGASSASIELSLEGERMNAIAYEGEDPKDDLAVVAVFKDAKASSYQRSVVIGLGVLSIVIFAVGSLMLFIVLYLQHADLKRFSGSLKRLALGKPKEEAPKDVSRDMRELWRSYGEIGKRIEQINYDKYMIFEAYYRFAPKGIEDIFGKDSILDVKNGDVVTVSGTMVLLSIDDEESFQNKILTLSGILVHKEQYVKNNEGILVSRDPGLNNILFLLRKEAGNTVSEIVQSLHVGNMLEVHNLSVMIYRDQLTYGVVGSNTTSLPYIDSEYSMEMNAYAAWFRRHGVSVVVTDKVIANDDVGEHRYVGSALFRESGDVVRFYEILDAYPAKTRQLMLINREKFENTLELFYSRDFYLARNQFMEILKECPEDGIVKWYIFECEKYMNGEADLSQSSYIQID